MSEEALGRIGGYSGGFSGIENYYAAKIERLEAEAGLERDNRFAAIARSAVMSETSAPQKPYELPYSDRAELKQPSGSMSAQNFAMNSLMNAPV